jgi:hypothetical protein
MSQIVCLILEGASSQAVQDAAIAQARQPHMKLTFLHVVDVKGLGLTSELLLAVAERELTWLGRTSLNLAQKRAYTQGVTAAATIRFGSFFPTIQQFLREHQTEYLFIGKPRPDMPHYEERLEKFNQLVQTLTSTLRLEVYAVANEEKAVR